MKALILLAVIGLKSLLCKGIAVGLILLLAWGKGRRLRFSAEGWNRYLSGFSDQKAEGIAIGTYLAAGAGSSLIAYLLLRAAGFSHSREIALALFGAGCAVFGIRYRTKGRGKLLGKMEEMRRDAGERM